MSVCEILAQVFPRPDLISFAHGSASAGTGSMPRETGRLSYGTCGSLFSLVGSIWTITAAMSQKLGFFFSQPGVRHDGKLVLHVGVVHAGIRPVSLVLGWEDRAFEWQVPGSVPPACRRSWEVGEEG